MSFEPIMYLGILIIAAKLLGEAMHRIGQPTIIGNVLAGIIVGPALFALVDPIEEIDLFISIGVFFLFFLIGLEEIDLPGLFRVLRGRIFVGSAVGFLVPFFAAILFALSFSDMDLIKSFAIASVVGASSLGVTAKNFDRSWKATIYNRTRNLYSNCNSGNYCNYFCQCRDSDCK